MNAFKHGDRVRFTAPAVTAIQEWRDKVGTVMDTRYDYGEIVTILWDNGEITHEGAVVLEEEHDV